MRTNNLMKTVGRKFHKAGFKIKKYSPEILAVAGVAGIVTSAVMACKATTKISTILDEAKGTVETIHECVENPDMKDKYTEEDSKKDLLVVYTQTGFKLVKLYGPSVVLGAASIGCILTSNKILHKRNLALAAAYTTIDKGFKQYRGRVIERFGEALDKELKYNIKAREIEEIVVNEKGKEKVVKKTIEVSEYDHSDYARFFDEYCAGWEKDAEYNLMFLRAQQNHANDLLRTKGHLFLNEVYDMLGMPRTRAGQIVGWVYDEKNPVGDNFVDFGIYDINKSGCREFVNGYERSILLDFNVDGNIWELMH